MVFSDLKFIYIFLPVFFLLYFLIPRRFSNLFVFFASLVFYTLGTLDRPLYALLFLADIFVTFLAGLMIQDHPRHKRLLLVLAALYNFGLLFAFKYQGFICSGINSLLPENMQIPLLNLVLPVGISFYTFQAMSYVADVYRGNIRAERSFVDYGAYISMFPQLVAGPIVTYPDIRRELKRRTFSLDNFSQGLKLFAVGLGCKVIIANNIGGMWRDVTGIGFDSLSTPYAWLAAIAYSLQLYFDFFGYSLMAKGMGRMMGFTIPDNFNDPYISVSMTEFWRRWHMTLSSWFRDYVNIPLGGSRCGRMRTFFNLLVVWLLTGLWHGADWNFLIWGLVIFVIIAIEKLGLKNFLDKHRIAGHIYMLLLIPLFWSIFAITDLSQLGGFFSRLFPFGAQPEFVVHLDVAVFLKQYGVLFLAGILLSTPLGRKIYLRIKDNALGAVVLCAIFALSVYFLCIGLNDPFLYFRF